MAVLQNSEKEPLILKFKMPLWIIEFCGILFYKLTPIYVIGYNQNVFFKSTHIHLLISEL